MYAEITIIDMNTFIQQFNEQSFDWLTWRNGSVLSIFKVKHRYGPICKNRETIRRYAIGYCKADNIPCRPKEGWVAVMFDTNQENCNPWWTHLTSREFNACFPGAKI